MSISPAEISNLFFKSNASFWEYIIENNVKTMSADESFTEFLPIEGAFYACMKFINGKEVFINPLKAPPQLVPPINITNPRFQAGYVAVALNFVTRVEQLADAPSNLDWKEVAELRSSVLSRVIGEHFDAWLALPSPYVKPHVTLSNTKGFFKIYDNDLISIKVVGGTWAVSFFNKFTFTVSETITVDFNREDAPTPIDALGFSPFIGCSLNGKPGVFDMRSSEFTSLSVTAEHPSFRLSSDSLLNICGDNALYIMDMDSETDDIRIEPITPRSTPPLNSNFFDEETGITAGYIGNNIFCFASDEVIENLPKPEVLDLRGEDILVNFRTINLTNNLPLQDTVTLSVTPKTQSTLGSPFADELGPLGKKIAILSTAFIFCISLCACGLLAAGITSSSG